MSDPKAPEHPGQGPWEPEDPMSLHATQVDGDPEAMLAALVEEYARMGWDAERVERLFERPFFQATHRLWKLFGPEGTRERIRAVLSRCGVLRTRTTVQKPEATEGEALHV